MEYYQYLHDKGFSGSIDKDKLKEIRKNYYYAEVVPSAGDTDETYNAAMKEFKRQEQIYKKQRDKIWQGYKKDVINTGDDIQSVTDLFLKKAKKEFSTSKNFFKDGQEEVDIYEAEKKTQELFDKFERQKTIGNMIASNQYYNELYKEEVKKVQDLQGNSFYGTSPGASLFGKWFVSRTNARSRQMKEYADVMETNEVPFDKFGDALFFENMMSAGLERVTRSLLKPKSVEDDFLLKSDSFLGDVVTGAGQIVGDLPLFALGPISGIALSKMLSTSADEISKYQTQGGGDPFKISYNILKSGTEGALEGSLLKFTNVLGSNLFGLSKLKLGSKLAEKGFSNPYGVTDKIFNSLENTIVPIGEAGSLLSAQKIMGYDPDSTDFGHALLMSGAFRLMGQVKNSKHYGKESIDKTLARTKQELSIMENMQQIIKSKVPMKTKEKFLRKEIEALEKIDSVTNVARHIAENPNDIYEAKRIEDFERISKKYDDATQELLTEDIVDSIEKSYDPGKMVKELGETLGLPFHENYKYTIDPEKIVTDRVKNIYLENSIRSNASEDLYLYLSGKTRDRGLVEGSDTAVYSPAKVRQEIIGGRLKTKREYNGIITEKDVNVLNQSRDLKPSWNNHSFKNAERIIKGAGAGLSERIYDPLVKADRVKSDNDKMDLLRYKDRVKEIEAKYGEKLTTKNFENVGIWRHWQDAHSRSALKGKAHNIKEPPKLTAKEREYNDYVEEIMNKKASLIDDSFEVAGIEKIGNVKSYLQIIPKKNWRQRKGFQETYEEGYITDNMKEDYDVVKKGSLSRKRGWGTQHGIELNADKIIKNYIEQANGLIVKTPISAKIRTMIKPKVLNDGTTFDYSKEHPQMNRFLMRVVDAFDGIPMYDSTNRFYKILDTVTNNVGKAFISMNKSTIITQLAAVKNGLVEAPHYMMLSLKDIGSMKKRRIAIRESNELQTRIFETIQSDLKAPVGSKHFNKLTEALSVGGNYITKAGFTPMKYADFEAALLGYMTAKKMGVKKGLKGKELIDFADFKVRNWNASGKQYDIPHAMRHPLGRAWLKFMTFPINEFNYLMEDRLGISPYKSKTNIQDDVYTIDKSPARRMMGTVNFLLAGGVVNALYEGNDLFSPVPDPIYPIAQYMLKPQSAENSLDKALYDSVAEALSAVPLGSSLKWGISGASGPVFMIPFDIVNTLSGAPMSKPLIEPLAALLGNAPAKQLIKYYRHKKIEEKKKLDKSKKKDDKIVKDNDYYKKQYNKHLRKMQEIIAPKKTKKVEEEIKKGIIEQIMEFKP